MREYRFFAADFTEYDVSAWTPLDFEHLERIEPHDRWWECVPMLADRDRLIDEVRD